MGTVVVATDLSRVSEGAVEVGIDLARRLKARLLLLNVLDLGRLSGLGRHDRVDQARAEREPLLLDLVRNARDAGVEAEYLLFQGSPVEAITEAATSEGVRRSDEETAQALRLSRRTVERSWQRARAHLERRLVPGSP